MIEISGSRVPTDMPIAGRTGPHSLCLSLWGSVGRWGGKLGLGPLLSLHCRAGLFRQNSFPLYRQGSCQPGLFSILFPGGLCFCLLSCICIRFRVKLRREWAPVFCSLEVPAILHSSGPCFPDSVFLGTKKKKRKKQDPDLEAGPRHVLPTSWALGPVCRRGTALPRMCRWEQSRRPTTLPCLSWGPGDLGTAGPEPEQQDDRILTSALCSAAVTVER